MRTGSFINRDRTMSQLVIMSFRAAAFGMLFALALPAHAGDRLVKTRVAPLYPEIARRMKISGAVKLEVTVDAEGKVTAVKTLEGNRMLSLAAEDAVHKWKFAPGDGVETMTVDINFALAQ